MSVTVLCVGCTHWNPYVNATNPEYNGTSGQCRFDPPRVVASQTDCGPGGMRTDIDSIWPTTSPSDWCGKGAAK